jgi:hypothetical protein
MALHWASSAVGSGSLADAGNVASAWSSATPSRSPSVPPTGLPSGSLELQSPARVTRAETQQMPRSPPPPHLSDMDPLAGLAGTEPSSELLGAAQQGGFSSGGSDRQELASAATALEQQEREKERGDGGRGAAQAPPARCAASLPETEPCTPQRLCLPLRDVHQRTHDSTLLHCQALQQHSRAVFVGSVRDKKCEAV